MPQPQSPSGPPTHSRHSAEQLQQPHTPRGPPGAFAQADSRSGMEAAHWRMEVESLQQQLKGVLDVLQDQHHALAMEAQERAELMKLLQNERAGRERDVQELREALESERYARARDMEELRGCFEVERGSREELTRALQAEVTARTSDARELAKSLQAECNARASEVEQLAKVFQSEREVRVQEAEELAEALRSEFAGLASVPAVAVRAAEPEEETDHFLSTHKPDTSQRTKIMLAELEAAKARKSEMYDWKLRKHALGGVTRQAAA